MESRRPLINSLCSLFALLIIVMLFLPGYTYAVCSDSWASKNPSGSDTYYGLAVKGSRIVAVCSAGIRYSDDGGSNWTSALASGGFKDICYSSSKDMFVAVGSKSGSYGILYTSTDGANWTSRTSNAGQNLWGVRWNGTRFVAVGSGAYCYSTNGTTWSGFSGGTLTRLACNPSNGILVAAGSATGKISRSTDNGSNWTEITAGGSYYMKAAAYGNGKFVVANSNGDIYYSTNNGVNWSTAASNPEATSSIYSIEYCGDTFIGGGAYASSYNAVTSTDGVNWTSKNINSVALWGVGYDGTNAYALGASATVYKSSCCSKTKGLITDPTSGTLPGPQDIVYWSAGACLDATPYRLTIGSSSYGGTDVYDSGWTTSTSKTVTTMTTGGGTAYIRLATKYSDASTENDDKSLTFAAKASVSSPSTSSALTGATVTFSRDTATGSLAASPYKLIVGSSSGGSQYHDSGWSTASSFTVNNLPTNGSSVYVRLYTKYATNETPSKDYVYTAANFVKATITAPTQGETLTSKVKTITWNAGTGVRTSSPKYRVLLGSSAGASDISNLTSDTTSVQASNLPSNGSTIHVTLYTYFTDNSSQTDAKSCTAVTYTAASVSSPANSSTLTSKAVTFTIGGGAGVRTSSPKYRLLLGTTAGASDINNITSDTTSIPASNLPSNGSTVYARLITYFTDDSSSYNSTSYTAVTFTAATVSSPANSSTLTSKTVTFTWSGGVGVSTGSPKYRLLLGTTAGASDINNITSDTTSAQASNLPSNGSTVYAKLITYFTDSSNSYNSTSYTAVTYTAASVSSPANSSTLTSKTVTFTLGGGVGVRTSSPKYRLLLGTTAGASDINNITSDTTSIQASNLPSNGSAVHATLVTYFTDDTSSSNASSYTAVTYTAASVSSPTNGSTLTNITATFTWSGAAGVRTASPKYRLLLGTTAGASDINNITSDSTSVQAGNLPNNGSTVYAKLITYFTDDSSNYNSTSYTAVTYTKSSVQTPTPGSMFSGVSQAFTLSAGSGTGTNPYRLTISSTGAGGTDRYDSGWTSNTNVNSGDVLYASGATAYVRLYTKFTNDSNQYNDYTYTWVTKSAVTSPTSGSTLTSGTVTFGYSTATGTLDANPYQLLIGTTGAGSSNVHAGSFISATSKEVTGIPTSGGTLYVRLITKWSDTYSRYNDYTYTAATFTAAAISNPTAGTTLDGSNDTFSWSAGAGLAASPYHLTIGTTQGGTNVYDSGWITNTSKQVTTLPVEWGTSYVRLQTKYSDNSTTNNDYSYNFAYKASITSPATGTALSGASVTFSRDTAMGSLAANPYRLTIGSSAGGTGYYDSGWISSLSFNPTALPTNGSTVYVRLATKFGTGETPYRDLTYTAANVTPGTTVTEMTSPIPGTLLTSTSAIFQWTSDSNATEYYLRVGTAKDSSNIYGGSNGTSTTKTVTGITLNDCAVYVKLSAKISGSWVDKYYIYGTRNPSGCGLSWTEKNRESGFAVNRIATNGSIYVAAGECSADCQGEGGIIKTSTDLVTWTRRTTGFNYSSKDVIYASNKNLFVASSNRRAIITSTNGINWTNRKTEDTNGCLYALAYNGTRFVAAGSCGYIPRVASVMHSTNGTTWTEHDLSPGVSIEDMTYAEGKFIAVGSNYVFTSTNGLNWTWTTPFSSSFRAKGITYGKGKFLICGTGASYISADGGATWAKTNSDVVDGTYMMRPCFAGEKFIAGLGAKASQLVPGTYAGVVQISNDGMAWEPGRLVECTRSIMGLWYDANNNRALSFGPQTSIAASTCSCAGGSCDKPAFLAYPVPGNVVESTSSPASLDFSWTFGKGVTEYYLKVGTTKGGSEYFGGSTGTASYKRVSSIVFNGGYFYVTLRSKINGEWQDIDYKYKTANKAPSLPKLKTPVDYNGIGQVTSASLKVNVSDPEADTMSVSFYGREVSTTNDFRIIHVMDTQWYSETYSMYMNMGDAIVSLSPAAVLQVGDIVNYDNQPAHEIEWIYADECWDKIEAAGIPYMLTIGNHDQYPHGVSTGSTEHFNQYFPVSRFSSRAYWGGAYSSDTDSRWIKFTAGGMNFLALDLEYNDSGSPSGTYTWANGVLSDNSTRRAIVFTHSILDQTGAWSIPTWGNGEATYDALAANSNLFMMLCGHMEGDAYRKETYSGRDVHIMLFDYQDSTPYATDGGWLRVLEFSPSTNEIHVRTVRTWHNNQNVREWDVNSNNRFWLSYDMGGSPASFSLLGTVNNVSSGSDATFTWSSLSTNKTYEWYAVANDGTVNTSSCRWRFKTTTGDTPPTNPTIATMISPPTADDGAVLQSATDTFTWNLVAGGQKHWVDVGTVPYPVDQRSTSGPYYWDINDSGQLNSNVSSWTIHNLPIDGNNVYVQLSTKVSDVWYGNNYIYTTKDIANIISPANGSTLTTSDVNFVWSESSDPEVLKYYLQAGSEPDGWDLGDSDDIDAPADRWTFEGLPIDGNDIYVVLSTCLPHHVTVGAYKWYGESYVYHTSQVGPAAMSSPINRTNLTSSTTTFSWTTGGGVTQYNLQVGTAANATAYHNYTTSSGTSREVTGLPTDGSTVYVKLRSQISSSWQENNYTYTSLKNAPSGTRSFLTAGNKAMVVHATSDEHLYLDCGASTLAYTMQIIKESDSKYITIYHGEPNKVNLTVGDAIKAYVRNGSFTYSLSSGSPYFVLWGSTTDNLSRIWSSDATADASKPWHSWGGAANPMVVKGPSDSYYYVHFVACTDTDGDRHVDDNEADFSHFLGVARTTSFGLPSDGAWQIRNQLPAPDNYCWKTWATGDYTWDRPRCLDDITGAQLTSVRTNYYSHETQGLLGSICYNASDSLYYFFYSDVNSGGKWHLYYRTTPDIDELQASTSWTAAAKANTRELVAGTLVKVAPAHDMDRWAVIYHAIQNNGSNDGDIMVQYTENMNVVGTGGISDIVFYTTSGYDSHYLGRQCGTLAGGATCYQHYFMTDPAGRLDTPDDKPDNAASGGLVTFADHATNGLWGGEIYCMGWDMYVPQATDPSPANAATGVSTSADLSWDAGYKATSYKVYFGTSSTPTYIGEQVGTTYDPGTLQSSQTYYWHIDAVNGDNASVTAGKTWSFTTQ